MSGYSKKILIIDDEIPVLKVLSERFKREQYLTHEASDGESGLNLALTEFPDIILLDLLMPKKDGIHFFSELRQHEWGKHVPVVVLTNSDPDEQLLKDMLRFRPAFYFVKSECDLQEVVEKVKEIT